jgi:hypothetical protein
VVQSTPINNNVVVQTDEAEVPPAPMTATKRQIDLGVKEVRVVEPGTSEQGPMYRVFITNKGPMALDVATRVALVAIKDSEPTADTPRMVESLKSLAVGETAELNMRLPVAAGGFPMMLVAVEIPENFEDTNEQDNLAQGEVAQLAMVTAAK